MRAARHTSYGAPDVLQIVEVARPTPAPGQILVEVHASMVTQGDRRMRAADFPGVSALFGRLMFGLTGPRRTVPGDNFAGRVVAVGEGVGRFEVGDDVFGSALHGAHAEYVCVDEGGVVAAMPSNCTYREAAALPYGALTAWVFLFEMAKVQRGERVLIVGATGGVGRMAVQVASHLGAHVTAVGSRDEALIRQLGADDFIDYRQTDVTRTDARWDVIFDTTEQGRFRRFRRVLGKQGRYLTLYARLAALYHMLVTRLFRGPRAIVGVAMGTAEQMDTVRHLAEAGGVEAVIAETYPLEEIVEAHRALERGGLPGAVLVDVRPPSPRLTSVPRRVA